MGSCGAPHRQQRCRAASAQAAPAEASTNSSTGSDGLALSDSAVERLKELQAEVRVWLWFRAGRAAAARRVLPTMAACLLEPQKVTPTTHLPGPPAPCMQSSGPVALRVTVEGGGCSGFQYEFAIEEGAAAQQLAPTDRLFERDGVRLVCDDISLEFLKGAVGEAVVAIVPRIR